MKKITQKTKSKTKNTLLDAIEKTYGKDFGMGSDQQLETMLKKAGFPSLSKLLFPK